MLTYCMDCQPQSSEMATPLTYIRIYEYIRVCVCVIYHGTQPPFDLQEYGYSKLSPHHGLVLNHWVAERASGS